MFTTIAHAPALGALQHALDSGRPAHAYAFIGPPGVGKGTGALEFAAALNCTGAEKPCGECRACRDTMEGRHPDVERLAPGGICDEPDHRDHADSRDLRICQIRRLQRIVSLAPYSGGRRVAIIDAADTLHAEAANAFLKTLEEPPAETVLILLVEREERLPETVLSRCQRVPFRRLDAETVFEALRARGAEEAQAREIASVAGGRLGWAIDALKDPSVLQERHAMLDDAMRVAHAGRVGRFSWARSAENRAPEVRERYLRTLQAWESWWRDILAAAAGNEDGIENQDRGDVLRQECKLYATGDVVRFLRVLLETREYLQANVDPQLALENLTLDLPRPRVAAGFGQ
jgi:DNA polymerase-3 subunit delta'